MAATVTELALEINATPGRDLDDIRIYLERDGVELLKNGYKPSVHPRRQGLVGGMGTYEPVEESITFNVYSDTSPEDCLDKFNAIIEIIDAANAGQLPRLLYRVRGSRAKGFPAGIIIGGSYPTPQVRRNSAETDEGFSDSLHIFEIHGVTITITRLPWLDTPQTSYATQNKTLPAVFIDTFAEWQQTPSPLELTIETNIQGKADGSNELRVPNMLLAVSNSPGAIDISALIDAGLDSNASASWSSATNSSSYGSLLLQYLQGADSFAYGRAVVTSTLEYIGTGNTLVNAYVTYTATQPAEVYLRGYDQFNTLLAESQVVDVAATSVPSIQMLGTLYSTYPIHAVEIIVKSVPNGTITFDAFMRVDVSDGSTRIVAIEEQPLATNSPLVIESSSWWYTGRDGLKMAQTVGLNTTGRSDFQSNGQQVVVGMLAVGNRHQANGTKLLEWTARGTNARLQASLQSVRYPCSIVPR